MNPPIKLPNLAEKLANSSIGKLPTAANNNKGTATTNTAGFAANTSASKNATTPNDIYTPIDFSFVSDEEKQKREKYNSEQWAKELSKHEFYKGSRITDNARRVKSSLLDNEEWRVDVRKDSDNDGDIKDEELKSIPLVEAIVDSYDSALDLYIEKQMQEVIEKYGKGRFYNLRTIFGDPNSQAIMDLAKLGIRADAVGDHEVWQNRTYTFSLVDMSGLPEDATDEEIWAHVYSDEAEILEDAQGKKGSIIFADCLTADGTAQGAEMNLSSILDQMGYECVSKADFIGKEDEYYQMMEDIEAGLKANKFASSGETINDKYGETLKMYDAVCAVYGINAHAYGHDGWFCKARSFEQTKNAIERLGAALYSRSNTATTGLNLGIGVKDFDNDGKITATEILQAKDNADKAVEEERKNNPEEYKEKEPQTVNDVIQNPTGGFTMQDINSALEYVEKQLGEDPNAKLETIVDKYAKLEGIENADELYKVLNKKMTFAQ